MTDSQDRRLKEEIEIKIKQRRLIGYKRAKIRREMAVALKIDGGSEKEN